jgi:hypothetical protein
MNQPTLRDLCRAAAALLCAALLAACAGPDVTHYAAERPNLDLQKYFANRTHAWGMFQARSGEVQRRFTVTIESHGAGDQLILDEHFSYSDGKTQDRRWTLQRAADGVWHGTAPDVVGEALGRIAGNALNWRYTLRQPVGDTTYDLDFDDWMYLMDDNTLVNRARVSKFGVEVGQVTLFFRNRE